MKRVIRIIATSTMLLMSSWASAALVSISSGDLATDNTLLNFESATTGDIVGNESIFSDAGIAAAEFFGTSFMNLDALDVGNDGKALAANNNGLAIVGTNMPIDHIIQDGGFGFKLLGSVKQFGFQIVDEFNKLFEVQTYSAGALIDVLSYTPIFGAPPVALFESDDYIDEFRVVLKVPTAAFGIDNITLADYKNEKTGPSDIPEPWSLLLFSIGLLGLGLARKRNHH